MQKRITTAHILLIVTFGLYLAFQWCSQNVLPTMEPVMQIIIGQLILVLPGIGWMRFKRVDFAETLGFQSVSWDNMKMAVCVLVCAYPAIVILNMISMFFVKNAVASVIPSVMRLGLWPSLVIMAFMPAFNEEFLCRSILYQAYRPVSKVGGVLLSAFIFGLLHLNFNQMPYAFCIGIVFALMVEATGSVYTSMVMHFLLNGFNVGLNYYLTLSQTEAVKSQETANQMLLETMFSPENFVKIIMLMLAVMVISMLVTGIMITKTFKMNGRSIRSEGGKGAIVDIWVLFFIGFALILTYFNTVFL